MKESKDQSSNGKCENAIADELAGAHDKPKSQNIVRRKSNLPQVMKELTFSILNTNTVIKREFLNYKSVLKNSFFYKFYLEINVYS